MNCKERRSIKDKRWIKENESIERRSKLNKRWIKENESKDIKSKDELKYD